MTTTRTLQLSFAGGEIAPSMTARADDAKYRNGLARERNMLSTPTGVARKRSGFKFRVEQRNSAKRSIVKTFVYNNSQPYILEIGARAEFPGADIVWPGYIRFYTNGALVTYSAPAAYIPNRTFLDADVNVGTNEITFAVAHALTTGVAIEFTQDLIGNTLPEPLAVGVTYYAIVMSPTVIRVATTLANALLGTMLDITSALGGGTHLMNAQYLPGATAAFGGNSWYCMQNPTRNLAAQVVPGGDEQYWYPLPASGVYEIPVPYSESDLVTMASESSGDYMTFTHVNHGPRELRRVSNSMWTCLDTAFLAAVGTPSSVTVVQSSGRNLTINATVLAPSYFQTPTPHYFLNGDEIYVSGMSAAPHLVPDNFYVVSNNAPGGSNVRFEMAEVNGGVQRNSASNAAVPGGATVRLAPINSDQINRYKVSALDQNEIESPPSAAVEALTNNLFVDGAYNTISWAAALNARRYRVYKERDGLYGLIGETDGTSFRDDTIAPDMSFTPPFNNNDLSGGNNPATSAHFEQRHLFAGSTAYPRAVWMTRTGTETDLNYSLPIQADDRIFFEIAAHGAGAIKHMVPMAQLVILTSTGEYRVTPVNDDAVTPTSIAVRPQSYVGASYVPPILVNSSLLFCAARGGHVQEFVVRTESGLYSSADLSARAPHFFDNLTILDSAFSKAPFPVAWFVSSDGSLLSLTYLPEEEMLAWAQHTTDGIVERITVAQEGNEDVLYAVINRTINGATKRYLERLNEQVRTTQADWFFVDSGITYTGAATSVITGLGHLEGKTVGVLANGVKQATRVVASGQITLETPVTAVSNAVHVGLLYTGQIQTLPASIQVEALGHGRNKNVSKLWARLIDSYGFEAGPSTSALSRHTATATENGPIDFVLLPSWSADGQVIIQQADPLPLDIAGLALEVSVGGG